MICVSTIKSNVNRLLSKSCQGSGGTTFSNEQPVKAMHSKNIKFLSFETLDKSFNHQNSYHDDTCPDKLIWQLGACLHEGWGPQVG